MDKNLESIYQDPIIAAKLKYYWGQKVSSHEKQNNLSDSMHQAHKLHDKISREEGGFTWDKKKKSYGLKRGPDADYFQD